MCKNLNSGEATNATIDLSYLNNGMYLIELQRNNDTVKHFKIELIRQ